MTVEKKQCLVCGSYVGKNGMSLCGPCDASYCAAVTERPTERRYEGRLKVTKKGTLKFKGMEAPMPVLVEDLSHRGAKIKYAGGTSLFYNRNTHGDSMLILDIAELKLHTFVKVVWTAPVNSEESRAGLRFFWHS